MINLLDYPFLLLVLSFAAFWIASSIGGQIRKRTKDLDESNREDFKFVLGSTLTLLGLIIGFTFSMAVTRYDQRKNFEEEEANAIGTEYLRADLLPGDIGPQVRQMLLTYLDLRRDHFKTGNPQKLRDIEAETARLQRQMWSAVSAPALGQPNYVVGLAVSGMNDVFNAQGYTRFAWWNRIPAAAWALLVLISVFCNGLLGFAGHGRSAAILVILPIALAISFFLIADIDSPGGVIRVQPENLDSLAASLHAPKSP